MNKRGGIDLVPEFFLGFRSEDEMNGWRWSIRRWRWKWRRWLKDKKLGGLGIKIKLGTYVKLGRWRLRLKKISFRGLGFKI